jgi:hypothetical protein
MPTLACRVCGRVVYTTAPLDTLFAEERRCPRCGSILDGERREAARRKRQRRATPSEEARAPEAIEQRISDRRQNRRRRDEGPSTGGA